MRLIPTSGSTAARKLIPFTPGLQRELNSAIGPWMIDLARMCPEIAYGPAYWSVTPMGDSAAAIAEESRVPICFDDDSRYLGGARAWLVDGAMAVPSSTRHIADLDEFRQTVLLHLLSQAELRLISVWHPSFLTLRLDTLARDWDHLIQRLAEKRPARARVLRRTRSGRDCES